MAEIKRYDICAVIAEIRNGEYILYSDHLAALKAAVEKEREAKYDEAVTVKEE